MEDNNSPLRYLGFVRKQEGSGATFAEITKALRSQVWNYWDNSSHSPPKTRPPESDATGAAAKSAPELQVLAWQRSRPIWPDVLCTRFPDGSEEHATLQKKKEEFMQKFPAHAESAASAANEAVPRVGGLCDYSVDQGIRPTNWNQEISLAGGVKEADFTVTRLD